MSWLWWWLVGWIGGVMVTGSLIMGCVWLRNKLTDYRAWMQACEDEDRRSWICRDVYTYRRLYGFRPRIKR